MIKYVPKVPKDPVIQYVKTEESRGELNLLYAIIETVVVDLCTRSQTLSGKLKRSKALAFLSVKNKFFRHYCHLLDLEPEWVVKKVLATVDKRLNSPFKVRKLIRLQND